MAAKIKRCLKVWASIDDFHEASCTMRAPPPPVAAAHILGGSGRPWRAVQAAPAWGNARLAAPPTGGGAALHGSRLTLAPRPATCPQGEEWQEALEALENVTSQVRGPALRRRRAPSWGEPLCAPRARHASWVLLRSCSPPVLALRRPAGNRCQATRAALT